jgi:hypothetical protein
LALAAISAIGYIHFRGGIENVYTADSSFALEPQYKDVENGTMRFIYAYSFFGVVRL